MFFFKLLKNTVPLCWTRGNTPQEILKKPAGISKETQRHK
jgi:hypothetical protein